MSWRPKGRQTLTSIHAENDDCNIFVILSMRIPTTTCILPFVGRWQGIEDTYARKGGICSWRFSRRWCLHELLQLFDERKRLASQTTQGLRGCFLTTNTMTYLVPEIDRIRGVEHMKEHVHERQTVLGRNTADVDGVDTGSKDSICTLSLKDSRAFIQEEKDKKWNIEPDFSSSSSRRRRREMREREQSTWRSRCRCSRRKIDEILRLRTHLKLCSPLDTMEKRLELKVQAGLGLRG